MKAEVNRKLNVEDAGFPLPPNLIRNSFEAGTSAFREFSKRGNDTQ
jgi:hypothetical protein